MEEDDPVYPLASWEITAMPDHALVMLRLRYRPLEGEASDLHRALLHAMPPETAAKLGRELLEAAHQSGLRPGT